MSTSNVSPPVPELDKASEPTFYVVSVKKLLIMLFFTFGLYGWYWSYRNWATCKRATGARVIPILRTLFDLLFIYAFLKRVDHGLRSRGMNYTWSPALLTLGIIGVVVCFVVPLWIEFVIIFQGWLVLLPLIAIFAAVFMVYLASCSVLVLKFLLMVFIQRAINTHERDPHGSSNNCLTLANWLWMLGIILFFTLSVLLVLALPQLIQLL